LISQKLYRKNKDIKLSKLLTNFLLILNGVSISGLNVFPVCAKFSSANKLGKCW